MKKVYIIGICGKATAAVALMFKDMGYIVGGSDSNSYPPISTFLKNNEISFETNYNKENISKFNPDIVLVGGSATYILSDNPETKWAISNDKKVLTYSEILQQYLVKEKSVVVTGTYGKGTISAMLTWILETAGLNPSFMIGGLPNNFKSGIRNASSELSVIEGDEYPAAVLNGQVKSKFFYYNPTHLIITSMQWDHLDIFKTEKEYIDNFQKLVDGLSNGSVLLTNNQGENIDKLKVGSGITHIEYGKNSDISFSDVKYQDNKINYKVKYKEESISISSNFFGEHNINNSIASILMAKHLGVSNENIENAFITYKHLKSHQELIEDIKGVKIYSDLAHSAIKAKETIKAFSQVYDFDKIRVVFDVYAPSMKSEKSLHWFDGVFGNIKKVYIPKILASKTENGLITGKDIVSAIKKTYEKVVYIPDDKNLIKAIASDVKQDDVVIFMSSGDVSKKIELLRNIL